MLTKHVYVRIRRDRLEVRCLETGRTATRTSSRGFSTDRLLVGSFTEADSLLKEAVDECIGASQFVPASRTFVMHPVEMTEGGLSEVEERVLRELAAGSRAARTVIHVGDELTDDRVREAASKA